MTPFEKLSNSLTEVEKGNTTLFEFYIMLWKNGVLLKAENFNELLTRVQKISDKTAQLNCLYIFTEGYMCTFFPTEGNAFEKLTNAIELFQQTKDNAGEGAAQCLLAIYFKNLGLLDKAQANVEKAILNISENGAYHYFLLINYYQAGEIHHLLKDYEAAINYFHKGIELSDSNVPMKARIMNGLGTIYLDKNELDIAFEFFQKSLKHSEGINNFLIESKNYADISTYYFRKKDFEQSLQFQLKSLKIREEKKLGIPLIGNYIELAELLLKQNNYTEALIYALLAEKFATEMNAGIKLYQVHRILSSIYEIMGNSALALRHFKSYHKFKNEVNKQENTRKIKQISINHEIETVQNEKKNLKLQNIELKNALEDIGASVRYAKRIQEAILPSVSKVKEYLPNAFVIYKPKDIVGGDFYWIECVKNVILFAAADCTGHGVSGAMKSLVCSNALNRSVKEYGITDPAQLLNKTRELIIEQFQKSGDDENDGMDISLCVLKNNTLLWGGANNPLWVIRKGELLETKPDMQHIGKHVELKSFNTKSIELQQDDTIYIFTDGYANQFGGEFGEKLQSSSMQILLLSIQNETMDKQKKIIEQTFTNWKGTFEQVDDVCIIGVKV